jgi:transposase
MTINKKETVHVITSVERRRRWSIYEKKAIVEETYEAGKSVSYVARKHGIVECSP